MNDMANVRKLRLMLEGADTEGRGVWRTLRERFPEASLIATPDDALAALELAYEIGYGDGESNAIADFHEDNPAAVQRARKILGLPDD